MFWLDANVGACVLRKAAHTTKCCPGNLAALLKLAFGFLLHVLHMQLMQLSYAVQTFISALWRFQFAVIMLVRIAQRAPLLEKKRTSKSTSTKKPVMRD